MDTKDEVIKKAVSGLLEKHHLQDSIGSIDDVVLSYVLSIIEDLGDTNNPEENIDVDQFIEMMSAYIPGFSQIPSMEIYDWMFDIASQLSKTTTESSTNISKPDKEEVVRSQLNGTCNGKKSRQRSRKMSQSSCDSNSSTDKHNEKRDGGEIKLLLEMFPASCTIEIKHCLKHCNGDLEETAQLILQRQESAISLKPKQTESQHRKSELKGCGLKPDKSMKDHVVAKYSFVDTEDDGKTHRPPPLKQEPKKLIRYLDGKVVNTKGQKYTEITKPEDEEMKKTYVSLKPAKQYRFH
ncbi:hypothetical protein LOTGIDRAFT_183276 [Lottia gigantea]|uniref:CUE domain-containing protein n=1 Tax=Lottia gigantea TaxID=225164 RepID=V4A2T9_LOTGI|nr:hypothetical protein LOTGIDRAFT_183276 [Lottia gigantea]ESO89250.1 hypothetical protein LOTGIDRAFT_183276 [Lottia gigantea]